MAGVARALPAARLARPVASRRLQLVVAVAERPAALGAPSRRSLLLGLSAAGLSLRGALALQAEAIGSLDAYTDPAGFTIAFPRGWIRAEGTTEGASSARRVVAFVDPQDAESNISLVITNTSVEFSNLGSFGSPYGFGQTLVNTLDRRHVTARGGGIQPPQQAAYLMDARSTPDGCYVLDYRIELPGSFSRHLQSVVALRQDKFYNKLYTLTAVYPEAEDAKACIFEKAELIRSGPLQSES